MTRLPTLFDAARFRTRLELAIRTRGCSRFEAATEAGIDPATVSRILRGWRPGVESLYKLCAWLGVEPSEFRKEAS